MGRIARYAQRHLEAHAFILKRRLYLCECLWLEIDWRSRRPACCALGGTHSQRTGAAWMDGDHNGPPSVTFFRQFHDWILVDSAFLLI